MEATHASYDFDESKTRMLEILQGADAAYSESTGIPVRTSLTFSNGFYVDVSVIFVDLRDSTGLAEDHTRPVLAKLYRTYISEVIAVMRGDPTVAEIYIEGDGVWAVFNTTTKSDVQRVFETSAMITSLIDTLNIFSARRGYSQIRAGVGVHDGESLYIKAGYKGSGINEVVWIGRVVGESARLCKTAAKFNNSDRVQISEKLYNHLPENYRALLRWDTAEQCYFGDVVNVLMDEWVSKNG